MLIYHKFLDLLKNRINFIYYRIKMLSAFRKYKLPILVTVLVVLTTSVGISMDMHYCQGNLKNINLIGDAQTCHDKAQKAKTNHCSKKEKACHKKEQKTCGDKINHDDCCENKAVFVQLEEEFLQASDASVQVEFKFIVAFFLTDLSLESIDKEVVHYKNYKPPLLDKNIPLLMQSFLC